MILEEFIIKLEEIRNASLKIFSRPQLNRDFYKRSLNNDSFIEKKLGSKNVIIFSLVVIFLISLIILFINQKNTFIILAILLSTFFGPIQSASRVYYAKSIPNNKKYEFFGFYSFAGKVTSFIGPVLFGTISFIFSSPKLGMASLLILFVIGFFILLKVENDQTSSLSI